MKKILPILLLVTLGWSWQISAQTNDIRTVLFASGAPGVFNYSGQYKGIATVSFGNPTTTTSDVACNGMPIFRDAINVCFDAGAYNLTYEDIKMLRHNVPLAWEKRAFPGTEFASVTDTIYIKLVKMGITNAPYVRLKIMTSFGPEVLAAKLLDTQGPGIPVLNVNGTTNYDYTLTMSDPSGTASKDPDRIMIVVSKTATFSRPFFISATATPRYKRHRSHLAERSRRRLATPI